MSHCGKTSSSGFSPRQASPRRRSFRVEGIIYDPVDRRGARFCWEPLWECRENPYMRGQHERRPVLKPRGGPEDREE